MGFVVVVGFRVLSNYILSLTLLDKSTKIHIVKIYNVEKIYNVFLHKNLQLRKSTMFFRIVEKNLQYFSAL